MRIPAAHVGAALAAFALYLPALALSPWAHDSAELTAAAWTLGIGHPAGSPLYCQLLDLFALLLPVGSVAFRANLFSAVAAAVCVGVLSRLLAEEGLPAAAAAGLAAAFGWSRTFLSQAVTAEVYTLNLLLVTTALLFLRRLQRGSDARWLRLATLAWSLLLANYVAYAALTPLVVGAIAISRPRVRVDGRAAAAAIGLLVLGLSIYLYLPVRMARQPAVNWGHLSTMQDLIEHLQSRHTQERAFALTAEEYRGRIVAYARFPWRDLGILLPPLLLYGFGALWRRSGLALVGAAFALFDAFFVVFLDDSHLESEAYGIPATFGILLAGAAGIVPLAGRLPRLAGAAALAAAAGSAVAHFPACDRHDTFLVEDEARALLAALPEGSALVTHEDSTTNALCYLSAVEGARPDVAIYDHWGNLLRTPYPEPLHRVPAARRLAHIAQTEGSLVARLAAEPSRGAVAFADPMLDYEPRGFAVRATAGVGLVSGTLWEEPLKLPPRVGHGAESDWMIRQLVAFRELRQAQSDLEAGRLDAALSALDRAAPRVDLWEGHVLIAQRYLKLGRPGPAVEQARRAVRIRPSQVATHVVLARTAMAAGLRDEAFAAASRAAAMPGAPAGAFTVMGAVLADRQRLEEAAEMMQRAATLEPDVASHLVNLAIVEKRRGACDRARELLQDAVAMAVDDPRTRAAAAANLLALGDCGRP